MRDGHWTFWYPNGVTMSEGDYRFGLKDGRWLDHRGNGNIWFEARYDLGRLHGQYREWTRQGELHRKLEYDPWCPTFIASTSNAAAGSAPFWLRQLALSDGPVDFET